MAPHSSTFAWKIPWTEDPGRLQSTGSLELDTTERLHFHFLLSCTGEGNGNPLQYSCLENPRDGGTWWAAVYGLAQSRTRLKRLSSSSNVVSSLKLKVEWWLSGTRERGEWETVQWIWRLSCKMKKFYRSAVQQCIYLPILYNTLKIFKRIDFVLCILYHTRKK